MTPRLNIWFFSKNCQRMDRRGAPHFYFCLYMGSILRPFSEKNYISSLGIVSTIPTLFDFMNVLMVYRKKFSYGPDYFRNSSFWTRKYHFFMIIFHFHKFFSSNLQTEKSPYHIRMTVSSTQKTVRRCSVNAFVEKSITYVTRAQSGCL